MGTGDTLLGGGGGGEGGGGLPCDGLASRPGKSSNTPRHASC